jgi:hypothetical protein
MERFMVLWKQRLDVAKATTDKRAHTVELSAFGWWFANNSVDLDWALAQLSEVLKINGKVEVDHLVVERLSKAVETRPVQCVECLSLFVEGSKEGYEILGWQQHAQAILASALKSSDVKAKSDATALINRLDARGYNGFKELLEENK